MSRVQLALNVSDLDAAVDFYAQLFGSPPAKVHPGYANFAIADPPQWRRSSTPTPGAPVSAAP